MKEFFGEWVDNNKPSIEKTFCGAFDDQMEFIWKGLNVKVFKNKATLNVIETFISKSIALPVCEFEWKGIVFTIGNDFYGWKVSVNSPIDLDLDLIKPFKPDGLFDTGTYVQFPEDRIYDSFNNNKKQFTVYVGDNYDIYYFLCLIREFVNDLTT